MPRINSLIIIAPIVSESHQTYMIISYKYNKLTWLLILNKAIYYLFPDYLRQAGPD